MRVGLDTGMPVVFGVLTTEDLDQALARSVPSRAATTSASRTPQRSPSRWWRAAGARPHPSLVRGFPARNARMPGGRTVSPCR